MDFGLIALILTVAHIALDYIAPKTKTKADDKALSVVKKAQELMPIAQSMAGSDKPKAEATPTTQVVGFGAARDHRTK